MREREARPSKGHTSKASVNKTLNRRISRYVAWRWIRKNWLLTIVGPVAIAVFAVYFSDHPVSMQVVEARFLRWTVDQSALSDVGVWRPIVIADLLDGKTVMAAAEPEWVPPKPGDPIRLDEYRMLWSGARYRIH
jgi:hypothetical protein